MLCCISIVIKQYLLHIYFIKHKIMRGWSKLSGTTHPIYFGCVGTGGSPYYRSCAHYYQGVAPALAL